MGVGPAIKEDKATKTFIESGNISSMRLLKNRLPKNVWDTVKMKHADTLIDDHLVPKAFASERVLDGEALENTLKNSKALYKEVYGESGYRYFMNVAKVARMSMKQAQSRAADSLTGAESIVNVGRGLLLGGQAVVKPEAIAVTESMGPILINQLMHPGSFLHQLFTTGVKELGVVEKGLVEGVKFVGKGSEPDTIRDLIEASTNETKSIMDSFAERFKKNGKRK